MHTANVHGSIVTAEIGVGVELVALQTVGCGVDGEQLRARIEFGEAVVGRNPQVTVVIFQNAQHRVVGQALFLAVGAESLRLHIEAIQAALGAEPQRAIG